MENNNLISKIERKIAEIKANEEYKQEYMTLMRERQIAEESFADGLKEGIKLLKKFNIPNDEIIKPIMEDYDFTEEEAKRYL